MNILKIINGSEEASREKIIEEILKLEDRIIELEKEFTLAKSESIKIEQRELFGESVNPGTKSSAQKNYDSSRIRIEAAQDALKSLRERLVAKIKSDFVFAQEKISSIQRQKAENYESWRKEIIDAAATFTAYLKAALGPNYPVLDVLKNLGFSAEEMSYIEQKTSEVIPTLSRSACAKNYFFQSQIENLTSEIREFSDEETIASNLLERARQKKAEVVAGQ